MDSQDVLQAWRANNALCVELLEACTDDTLDFKPGKGKTIRSNFTHIVSVRRMWAEASLPKEAPAIPKLDWKTASREQILAALLTSSKVMEWVLLKRAESTKPSKWTLALSFAYYIAHEAHHRSQIEIALRVNGREPEDGFLYGLWEWDKKIPADG